jgi:DNA-binding CsgD family transcriptional regulator
MIGAVFSAEGGAIGVLGVHRPYGAERYGAADRRAVGAFLPHLARALRIGQRLDGAAQSAALLFESLDRLDIGIVIADAAGTVRRLNAVAEAMLARGEGVEIRQGRLRARTPSLQGDLMANLQGAVALAAGRGLAAPAPLRLEREGRAPWSLAAAPLRPRWSGPHWSEPMAMVFLRDPEFPPLRIEQLRTLFGLTRTEALVAGELARGRPLDQIARSLGLGLGTVRTHLKQVLAKTGTSRQAEAVAVLVRSVAALTLA